MRDLTDVDVDLLLAAAFEAPPVARTAWNDFVRLHPLDDVPAPVHPLLPLVAANLSTHPEPVADAARLAGLRRRQWYRSNLEAARYDRARQLLGEAGVESRRHGGLAYREYWPVAAARHLDDGALVVHPDDACPALAALEAGGFVVPDCSTPEWHHHLLLHDEDGGPVRLSVWSLGPWLAEPERELAWRSASDDGPTFHLLVRLAGELRRSRKWSYGPLWRADVRCLLAAIDADDFLRLESGLDELGLSAVGREGLELMGSEPVGSDSRNIEHELWKLGANRHRRVADHYRLARAAGRRVSPATYLDYRRHLRACGPSGELRIGTPGRCHPGG